MSHNIGEKARHGTYWGIILKAAQAFYHFLVLIVVARLLSPKEFGIIAVTMSIVTYLNSLTGFGFTSAIVQKQVVDKSIINTVFTFNLIVSCLAVPFCWLIAGQTAIFFKVPELSAVLPIMSLLIPIATFYNVPMAILRRNMEFKVNAFVEFWQYILFSTSLLVLAWLGFGVWSLVYSSLFGYFVAACLLLFKAVWVPRLDFSIGKLRPFINYGFWDLLRYHIYYVEENIITIILGRSIGATQLGYYDRANSLAAMPLKKIQSYISSVLFSAFSRISNDKPRLVVAFSKSLTTVSTLFIPLLTGIAVIAPYFVPIALGGKWVPMIVPLQILCLAAIPKILSDMMINFNVAINDYKVQTKINAAGAVLITLFCLLSVKYGLNAVATSYLLASLLYYLLCCYVTSRNVDLSILRINRCVFHALACSFLMAVVVQYAAANYFTGVTIANLTALLLLGVSSYALSIYLWPDQQLKLIINTFLSDFAKRGSTP